ncbi:MAG: type II toxin-antitoxin system PemK/MazF family toxin [Coriobacteriia bacterium]
MAAYIPRKGDLVALTFDPQSGYEQRGRRPALVVSNDAFNERVGLCVVCPITSNTREHPFHVPVSPGAGVEGVVMTEQMKSIDFRSRGAARIAAAPAALVDEVLSIIDAVLF